MSVSSHSVSYAPLSEPVGEPPMLGRRKAPRARLALPGRAVSFNGTMRCMILDVSQSGAQIGCEDVPKVGAMMVIEYRSTEFFGTVCWTEDQRFGMHFDELLTLNQVVELRYAADSFDRTERRRLLQLAEDFVEGRV